jgi:hypothetical protein
MDKLMRNRIHKLGKYELLALISFLLFLIVVGILLFKKKHDDSSPEEIEYINKQFPASPQLNPYDIEK